MTFEKEKIYFIIEQITNHIRLNDGVSHRVVWVRVVQLWLKIEDFEETFIARIIFHDMPEGQVTVGTKSFSLVLNCNPRPIKKHSAPKPMETELVVQSHFR